ncbi:hypothetical protein [Streptomyces sp. NPDC090798]|uniref:hypothetical protein n=1 Tax=Streptomyces sp. NPDC090798 TaxID=3365968 RepID=UPI003803006B
MRAENRSLLGEVFFDLRPRSDHHWEPVEKAATDEARAAAFGSLFTSATVKLPKGDYAYRLAERPTLNPDGFEVPEHPATAIRWIAGVDGQSA